MESLQLDFKNKIGNVFHVIKSSKMYLININKYKGKLTALKNFNELTPK